jgi:hypothetical protein
VKKARWWYRLPAGLMILAAAGCGVSQTKPDTAAVHEVQIQNSVSPSLLYAQRGDEIRWHNLLPHPVKLGLLGTTWRDHLLCQKGFSRFGQIDDLVVIPPQQYVSLCFAQPGTVRYNVWLDPKNLTGSMTPTSTIRID